MPFLSDITTQPTPNPSGNLGLGLGFTRPSDPENCGQSPGSLGVRFSCLWKNQRPDFSSLLNSFAYFESLSHCSFADELQKAHSTVRAQ